MNDNYIYAWMDEVHTTVADIINNETDYIPATNARNLSRLVMYSIPYNTNEIIRTAIADEIRTLIQCVDTDILIQEHYLENVISTVMNRLADME